jgi:hypothetical protein
MALNLKKHAVTLVLGVALVAPATALNSFHPQDRDQDRQEQNRDQDRDHDQNRTDRDRRGDQDYTNSKYYKQGVKDGDHDRDKHRSRNSHHKRFKNDDDRRAYEAGYNSAYGGERH